jgi:transposase
MLGADGIMLNLGGKPVYLCCGQTDMRKQINGLMVLVKNSFALDPFSEALFVFCNKARNRIKILEWDADGFWLYFKRLERGRFRWPAGGADNTMVLTSEELACLTGSAKLEKKLRRNEVPGRCTI